MRSKLQWQAMIALSATILMIAEGCSRQQAQSSQQASMLVAHDLALDEVRVYRDAAGRVWVPLEATAKSLGMDLHNIGDKDTYRIGETDAAYSVHIGQLSASEGDSSKLLPQAPKYWDSGSNPYMTTEALSSLIGTPVVWNGPSAQVVMTPIDDVARFDKQDPGNTKQQRVKGLSIGANPTDIVNYAKQFLGTPYEFAAGPYESTHTFDCSSFVKYVYGHFGVSLPRGSRDQAKAGLDVPIDQLQTGDLLFFNTPSRFTSNRIVGHVGIYMGEGKMIHTSGRQGVTIVDFNDNYRRRFLLAKRVG